MIIVSSEEKLKMRPSKEKLSGTIVENVGSPFLNKFKNASDTESDDNNNTANKAAVIINIPFSIILWMVICRQVSPLESRIAVSFLLR